MNQTELIDTVQSYLSDNLSVTVRSKSGTEDERPVPLVSLDAIDIEDIVVHNTSLAQVVETPPGEPDKRYFHFRYWARLDYEFRNVSGRETSLLSTEFRNAFRPLTENPRSLHDDISEVRLRGGGGLTETNVEDAESEMFSTVRIRTYHQMNSVDDAGFDSSTLDTIQNKLDDGYGNDFTVTNS